MERFQIIFADLSREGVCFLKVEGEKNQTQRCVCVREREEGVRVCVMHSQQSVACRCVPTGEHVYRRGLEGKLLQFPAEPVAS